MAFDKPQSRNEAILQNMLGANNVLERPQSRVEALLQEIAGQMPEANPSEGATTGTLERLKIGDDIYTVEGGGSGTSDYDALNNKPQIAGVTLSGDKSLADLGIASASAVSGILDGTDIDSFGDVETALGDKVDKVNGKGLSTNDYDDDEKAAVAAATTAIAGIKDGTTIDSFGDVETALGAIQDGQSIDSFADVETAIGEIKDGTTIDSFADVETALADKQDATDNSLETEAKTIVGAINEHEGDIDQLKSGLTNLDEEVNGDATVYPYADVITIEDAVPANLADCNVKIEPVQDLHGQSAPYVGGASKNKLPMIVNRMKALNITGTWSGDTYTINDVTFTILKDDDGNVNGIKINGTNNGSMFTFTIYRGDMSNVFTAGQTYTITDAVATDGRTAQYENTFTVADNWHLQDIACNFVIRSSQSFDNTIIHPQLENGSAPTSYAPWENICPISGHTNASVEVTDGDETTKTYTIALGSTIYGGTVDFDSGVMMVTHGKKALNAFSLWEYDQSHHYMFVTASDVKTPISNDVKANINSDSYNTETANTIINESVDYGIALSSAGYLIVSDARYTDATTYLTDMGSSELCYELATPFTVQLTPQQIQLLKGQNTLTASTGDISVTVNGVSGAIGSVQEQVNDLVDCIGWGRNVNLLQIKFNILKSLNVNGTWNDDVYSYNGVNYTFDVDDYGNVYRITANGTATPSNSYVYLFELDNTMKYSGDIYSCLTTAGSNTTFRSAIDEMVSPYTRLTIDEGNGDIVRETDKSVRCWITVYTGYKATNVQFEPMIRDSSVTNTTYEPYHPVIGTAVEELLEKVPDAPTTDGAYVLTVTVADGTPTYSWESAT